jgi:hypothetical protein
MLALIFSLALLAAPPVDTTANGGLQLAPGQTVRASDGAVLGRVERIVTGPDGRPRQVLVRVGGVGRVGSAVKALPVSALRAGRDGPTAALTVAEVQSLPAVQGR